jgi:two-component system, chemotaxis family, protein-glutamate methylesterase/glutaminase
VLWEIARADVKRYRCHTGHSFSVSSLLASQSEKIEETLWVSLRMFEERKNLLNNIAQQQTKVKGKSPAAQRAEETQVHIERIKAMLLAQQSKTWEETFTRVEKIMALPRVAKSARDAA